MIEGLQPLYYAVEALDENFPGAEELAVLKERVLGDVRMVGDFLDQDKRRDAGQHIRRRVENIVRKAGIQ